MDFVVKCGLNVLKTLINVLRGYFWNTKCVVGILSMRIFLGDNLSKRHFSLIQNLETKKHKNKSLKTPPPPQKKKKKKKSRQNKTSSGGGPVHVHVPIHTHP